jgi:hypothetical protein
MASRLTRVDWGTPKTVLASALTASGIDANSVALDNLTSATFTSKNTGYYLQESQQTTLELATELLAMYGGAMYVTADNKVAFCDTPKYAESGLTIITYTGKEAVDAKLSPDNRQLGIFEFRETYTLPEISGVSFASYNPKNSVSDLKSGQDASELPQTGIYQVVDSSDMESADLKQRATAVLAGTQGEVRTFEGVSTVPLEIGTTYKVMRKKFDGASEVLSLVAISIEQSYSFFTPANPANPADHFKRLLHDVTGLEPCQFYTRVTFVEATQLPRLAFQAPANTTVFYEAVVLGKNNSLQGDPTTDKIYVSLLHDVARTANNFDNPIEIVRRTEEISIRNAPPAPGTKVLVACRRATREFVLMGNLTADPLALQTVLAVSGNSGYKVEASVSLVPGTVTTKVDNNTFTVNKAQLAMASQDATVQIQGANVGIKNQTGNTVVESMAVKTQSTELEVKSASPAKINQLTAV